MLKTKSSILFVGLAVGTITIIGAVGIIRTGEKHTAPLPIEANAVDWPESSGEDAGNNANGQDAAGEKGSIAVPGTEVMQFKAEQKKQKVNLYNPGTNDCYFEISIMLEDRTVLYQSGLVPPGKGLRDIELEDALSEGEYPNAILRYKCLNQDEELTLTHLAEIKFTIQSIL